MRNKGGNPILNNSPFALKQDVDIPTLSQKIDEYKAGEEKKKAQINALQTQAPAPAPEQLDVGEARKKLKASSILASRSGGGGLKATLGA